MSETLVPCLICGETLTRVMDDAEMQPNHGIYCETPGNYGSTIHDSMDGEFLAFLICDPCLVKAGDQGRIQTYRKYRPICVPYGSVGRMVVGKERLNRPYIPWTKDTEPDMEPLMLDEEELEGIPVRNRNPMELMHPASAIRTDIEVSRGDHAED